MPETVPDDEAYDHMTRVRGMCKCAVCQRPQAKKHQDRWRRDQSRIST